MADNFLSQEEVDALLKGVNGDQDDAAAPEETSGVRTYNLATQERIVRGRMPTLEIINERFARLLRVGLFNFLRRSAEVSVGSVRVSKYSEFIRNLVVPTNLNLVHMKPLRGTAPDGVRSGPGVPAGRQPVRRRRPLPHPRRGPRLYPDRAAHHPAHPRYRVRGLHQVVGAGVPGRVRVHPFGDEHPVRQHRHAERGGGVVDLHGRARLGHRARSTSACRTR